MKKKYRITNWKEYNSALKKRGSLTVWIEEGFENTWYEPAPSNRKRGRPFLYSDTCINLFAAVRHIFKLALRQLEGLIISLFELLKIILIVPAFSRLSRRMVKTLSSIKFPSLKENIYIVVDSSGLKIYREKEWLKTKKEKKYARRVWSKIHIEVDGKGFIHASQMTDHKTTDRTTVPSLLEEVDPDLIEEVLGDTAYDGLKVYGYFHQNNIIPTIPSPKNAKVHSKNNYLVIRNEAVNYIKEKGVNAWENKHNFSRRNRVENRFYRIKTIFGGSYTSRKWQNQRGETRLLSHLLNQMTTLGIPKAEKVA